MITLDPNREAAGLEFGKHAWFIEFRRAGHQRNDHQRIDYM